MKQTVIATALLTLAASSAFAQAANVQGGSSNTNNVQTGVSNFPSIPIIAPDGYAGLAMKRKDGTMSRTIPLMAPVTLATAAATANQAGPFYANMPIVGTRIAQVWYNNQNATANVYSLRETTYPTAAGWPHFGGLVVGQVKGTSAGSAVYFGEWSPAVSGTPNQGNSTNLNMTNAGRTVFYVGDNAVTSMPTLVNAQYSVVGIRQTGVGSNLPHAPTLYTGTLTANYASGSGSITGSIARGSESLNFAGTSIAANGKFNNSTGTIDGRFYNNAAALAGIYKGGATSTHIAFGGKRSN